MKDIKTYSFLLYEHLIQLAGKMNSKGCYSKALKYLKAASWIQYVYSKCFSDSRIEDTLISISDKIERRAYSNSGAYILYDEFFLNNSALSQQYIRALIKTNKKIIIITQKDTTKTASSDVVKECQGKVNVSLIEIKRTGDLFEDAVFLYNMVMNIQPEKLFMQLQPHAVEAVTAFHALPKQIVKYQIDLTDHAFWVGAKLLDFDIVFREYGALMANLFRGISREKILAQPYYPIMQDDTAFKGLPISTTNRIVLVSGSAYHKVDSSDHIFQNFVKKVLDNTEDTIWLFAGDGNKAIFKELTENNKYNQRFHLIGQRDDLSKVFERCDIYINTFPVSGGLTGQIAAKKRLPILAFKSGSIAIEMESLICQKASIKVSEENIEDMYNKLMFFISNKDARVEYGNKLYECVIDQRWFDENFTGYIVNNKSQVNYSYKLASQVIAEEVSHSRIMQDEQNYYIWLVQHLGKESFVLCPRILGALLLSFLNMAGIKRIYERISRHK